MGCAFPMVISSDFRTGKHRDDDHEEDASYFTFLSEVYLSSIFLVTNHCSHFVAKIIDFHLSDQSSDQIVLLCLEVGKKSEVRVKLNSISFYVSPVSSLFRSPEKNEKKVIRIYINFQSKFSPMVDCMR